MGFDWEYYLGESYDSFDLGRAYEDAVFDACDAMRRYETPQEEEWFARPKENACFGIWYGHEVCYGGVWGGHTFTREERNRLECCEPIKFDYKTKKGKKRTVVGRLKETAYKGKCYLLFRPDYHEDKRFIHGRFTAEGAEDSVKAIFPKVWSSHEFSMQEVIDLLAGKVVEFNGKTTKGRDAVYTVRLRVEEEEDEARLETHWVRNGYV